MDKFDICIIGAGVVGLAIARQLSATAEFSKLSILLLEQETSFGQHTSSRNSEVIHAGIYYPTGSLKAKLCLRGKQLLYSHCEKFDIPFKRIGKLIVAEETEIDQLQALKVKAEENGVLDLQWIDKQRLAVIEPAVKSHTALLSPSTGIIDSHSYMQSLLHQAENSGVQFSPRTKVVSLDPLTQGFVVHAEIDAANNPETYRFECRCLINSAGLYAQSLAAQIGGNTFNSIPELHPCKGDYFSYTGRNPFSHLIYPMQEANAPGLGIHATLDLSAQLRFGPDSSFVNEITYAIDASKAEVFAQEIGKYFPGICRDKLLPAYSGIRPKLTGPDQPAADFSIQDSSGSDMKGLIQLFGIESPGLTASLAIGEYVVELIQRELAG
ncbi:MAG: NAD(P)/FAD-dependent oxidoreductase [Pseudohongiella sp.]|nr:NAD(P)/FAD-dependent oxidoreductase [Pseudohongiella sp.]